MIRLIEPDDPRLGETAGNELILAAIQGLAKTAGPGLRRELWLAEEEGGKAPAGAVCRTESGILATAAEAAAGETAAFLELLGRLPATVDEGLAKLLPGKWQRFPVLRYTGELPEEIPLCRPSAMGLVDCNIAAGAVPASARDELYAELHLRGRHGAAQIFLVPDEDEKPAAGACALLGRDHAVIGYLACLPEKRGQGYGTAALLAAVWGAMEAGRAPLLASREELVPFYTGRGFSLAGEVYDTDSL